MANFLFYFFAALTVLSALLVVVNKNAVNAAMFLILCFLGMAGLFVLLQAYFLAILQVYVYGGAVVALFLFIIMLLDVKASSKRPFGKLTAAGSAIGGAMLVAGVFLLFGGKSTESTNLSEVPAYGSQLKNFGYQLFTTYLLPLEITGFLLLIAMLGVIVLSKKNLPEPRGKA